MRFSGLRSRDGLGSHAGAGSRCLAGARAGGCEVRARFEGKVALVTGGASGIGLATAERLLAEGASVVIADRNGESAAAAATALRGRGRDAIHAATCDVTRGDQVKALVNEIVARHERLDVLFNNAGTFESGEVHEIDEEAWDRQIGVNLRSVYVVSHYVVPVMLAQGGGAIVNNASVAALVGDVNGAAYCASKGGVAQLTKAMALDYAARGIRVNAICCGEIDTPLFVRESHQLGMTPDAYRAILNDAHPMGRIGLPSEAAAAVAFLASGDASFVTGVLLPVDGGYSAI
jgi:meso-butanediol dehydrogenase/(S,S)-butanediol dehydrogenase/diacetyl reductase